MSEFTDRLNRVLCTDMKGYVVVTTTEAHLCNSIALEILEEARKDSKSAHFCSISDTRVVYLSVIFIDIIPVDRLDIVLIDKGISIVPYIEESYTSTILC